MDKLNLTLKDFVTIKEKCEEVCFSCDLAIKAYATGDNKKFDISTRMVLEGLNMLAMKSHIHSNGDMHSNKTFDEFAGNIIKPSK